MGTLGSGVTVTLVPLVLAYSINVVRVSSTNICGLLAMLIGTVLLVPLLDIWPELVVFFACFSLGSWLAPGAKSK
jgi:hypothetical protein